MQLILDQNQVVGIGEPIVGGKAKNLAWMKQHGFNVPAFVVVTTDFFRVYLESALKKPFADVMAALRKDPLAEAAAIRTALAGKTLPPDLAALVSEKMKFLPQGFLAVRSSVVGEDSQEASFAGQMETFLFLKTEAEVCKAIVDCFYSAFAERAIIYRIDRKIAIDTISAAVVCQVMIDSEVSGVVFTAHPNRGLRSQHLISAAWGLGEGIVSGECNADEFVVSYEQKKASILDRGITDKDHAVRFNSAQGYGTLLTNVEESKRHVPCLTDAEILELSQVCYNVALNHGGPQDIEFAFKGGVLFLLQTRPITMLPSSRIGNEIVWDNSNIQESYCGVTTPLTFSFASKAYRSVYLNTFELLGASPKEMVGLDPVMRNLLGLIRGRVYYNINNWYAALSVLPSFSANKEDMERMMGLQDSVDFVVQKTKTPWEKITGKVKSVKALYQLLSGFVRIKSLVEEFRTNFQETNKSLDRKSLFLRDLSDLYQLTKTLEKRLLEKWTIPIINDFYVMMMNGKVHRKLTQLKVENPSLTLNNLLSGEEGIESTEPTKFLLRMCDEIRKDPSLITLFANNGNSELMPKIQTYHPAFHKLCLEYIELYGDRTIGELKLESITLHEDPAFMFACLRNFLDNDKLTLGSLQRHEQDLRVEEEQKLFALLKGPFAVPLMKWDLRRLRNAVKNRENMRLARTRVFGMHRAIYLEMGKQLALQKHLKSERDIFYLTIDEIEQFFEGRSINVNLSDLVQERRLEFASYEGEDLPHHFKTFGSPYVGNTYEYAGAHVPNVDGETLQGLGCYPGIVEGKVRLIFSPEDEMSLHGQILCTVRTDPGWAPLFPSAGGIIVERGSSLSHSAVVARELGIPAIVNIPGLTKILKDGERIRMNGKTGLIERLDV